MVGSGTQGSRRVLIVWSESEDRGIERLGADLAAVLRASGSPGPMVPVTFDIGERMGALSLARTLVGALGGARTEAVMVASLLASELEREMADGPFDGVIALDTTAAIIVDRWTTKGLISAPVVGLSTRLRLDSAWRRHVDRLLVVDERQAEAARAAGFAPEDVQVVGVLPGPRIAASARMARSALRERFGLAIDVPVVLIVVEGLDELTTVLFQTTLISVPCQILFDVKDDDEAAALLRRRAKGFGVRAQIFGRVDEAADLWASADVIVARPTPRVERRAVFLREALVAVVDDEADLRVGEALRQREIGRTVGNMTLLASEVEAQLADLKATRERLQAEPRGELRALVGVVRETLQAGEALIAKRAVARRTLGVDASAPSTPGEVEAAKPSSPLEAIGPDEGEVATAAARDEELDAAGAEINARVTQRQREVARWERRLELARDKGDRQLVAEAEKQVDLNRAAMHAALAELATLDAQRRGRPASSRLRDWRLAGDFKRMEVENALDAIKRKLRGG